MTGLRGRSALVVAVTSCLPRVPIARLLSRSTQLPVHATRYVHESLYTFTRLADSQNSRSNADLSVEAWCFAYAQTSAQTQCVTECSSDP
jgi:hypothetical protein